MKKLYIAIALLSSLHCVAQEQRHIHFNGEHLDLQTISVMDQLFGYKLANGNYWINTQTGEWGFEGNSQVQGVLSQVSQAQKQSNQQQTSRSTPRAEINTSQNGSVVSGKLNGQNCTFVSAGGMTMKSCD